MTDVQVALLLFLLLVVVAVGAAVALFSYLVPNLGATRDPDRGWQWTGRRPWWGNPLIWLGLSATLVVLGVLVTPNVLPGIVVFVPFLWIGGSRRRRDPRGNGSAAD